jgi:hypothetical protein
MVHAVRHVPRRELRELQFHAPRVDVGEVQDIVDDAQQKACGALRLIRVSALFFVHVGFGQKTDHPENGVDGRPDFVAHVGQKFAFGPGVFFRLIPGLAQFVFQTPLHQHGRQERADGLDRLDVGTAEPGEKRGFLDHPARDQNRRHLVVVEKRRGRNQVGEFEGLAQRGQTPDGIGAGHQNRPLGVQ